MYIWDCAQVIYSVSVTCIQTASHLCVLIISQIGLSCMNVQAIDSTR